MSETWVWARYWQYDRIASCFDGAGAGNYDECVAGGWRTFFSGLPSNARILDLCTGNGAIALIAAGIGQADGRNFAITAVDQAGIDPPSHVTRHRGEMASIRFIGRTKVEELPFEDDSFDVAVSQYGVEYSRLESAVSEAARVVAPGGQVRFVVHASDGIIATAARTVIGDADQLLGNIDLIGATRRCLDAVGLVEGGDSSADARTQADGAVADFKAALRRTANHVPNAVDKMMFSNSAGVMLNVFQARHSVGRDAIVAKIDHVEAEILAHRGRLQALVDSALDRAGAEGLTEQLRAAGAVKAECRPLGNGTGLIGYEVTARFA